MKIRHALQRDPLRQQLANSGQARIASDALAGSVAGTDEKVRRELRAELETFVCKGKFADALDRILGRYLGNLDGSRQDAAWVSGFYGSGKSHLLKMLAHLWEDTRFDEDGATARGLVAGRVPDGVVAHLRELDVCARRIGARPVAAAGSLLGGKVGHVRVSVLSILLRAAGLPSQYPQARFCLWLRENGWLDEVRASVEAAGRDWQRELNNLYVSPFVAKALIAADPDLASDARTVRTLLTSQFPQPRADISTEEFEDAARQALAPEGVMPPAVLVLDEVQQFINEAHDRSQIVTDLAEVLQTRFQSRILLVAAGQSALSAGIPALAHLTDRFRVAVQLSDAEVETVTREVLLEKKPSAAAEIGDLFHEHAGEVSRHLQGTRLAVQPEDHDLHAADYPLLRTRRRLWEECFRTADPAGTQAQLRSQLRILHDALSEIGEAPLGRVIPASDLFRAISDDLVNAGVLLNEINTRIAKLDDGTVRGTLRADLCGLAFLIGKLPRQAGLDTGVRATPPILADLLVTDITADSGPFRNQVAGELEQLADEGVLLRVDDEYRIQTTEGAEWERRLREQQTALGRDEVEVAARREQLLGAAVGEVVSRVRPPHGAAKIRRKLAPHIDTVPDGAKGDSLRVWVRNGWSCSWQDVRGEAQARGLEDHVLHVHLGKLEADELRKQIVNSVAAERVLDHGGAPASQEGQEARDSMRSRLAAAERARDGIVAEIVRSARVFQGGGTEVFGADLLAKLQTGAEASLARLYPRFAEGDHRAWSVALRRAREKSGQPFRAVGWDGKVADHPVSAQVMREVGAGLTGGKVRDALEAAPYGWPRDAVDAALVALHREGHLRAERNGRPVGDGDFDQTAIAKNLFRPERVLLTARQRVELRGLFGQVGVRAKAGAEGAAAPEFVRAMRELAAGAGGEAPLPAMPDLGVVDELSRLTGNEQLAAIHARRAELEAAIGEWRELGERAAERLPTWELAVALAGHARGLAVADEVGPELDAIREQRSLLGAADPVRGCVERLAGALRAEVTARHGELAGAIEATSARLAGDPTWRELTGEQRRGVLGEVGLERPTEVEVDSPEALRRELDRRGLAGWRSEIDAVDARMGRALERAAEMAEVARVSYVEVRRGTLQDDEAVEAWVEEHRARLVAAVREGPVIVR